MHAVTDEGGLLGHERAPHPELLLKIAIALKDGSPTHTSFFIIKKDISLCYGLGMDMVHPDFLFQSIREKEFKREIKGMANS